MAAGVEIVGIGTAPSSGLRKGVVVNIDATVESIRKAVDEAELMAGCEIHSVYAGIAGAHVKGFNSHGVVAVKATEVSPGDVERVLDAARAVALPMDRQVLHVLPQEFVVDDQDGIKQPIGMAGVRLEAKVHIITASVTSTQNVVKCCERSGLARRRSRARAARRGRGGAHARGARARRRAGRHRRRHHRHRGLPRRRGEAHGGAADRRQPSDQRHRHRPAHAVRRRGEDQAALRLRARRHGGADRDDRGAERRRSQPARPVAAHPGRDHRAPRRGDLRAGGARGHPLGLRGHPRLRGSS